MLFNWFDHPLIDGWLEARLRAELHREDSASADDRPLERLEIPVIEPAPDIASEAIELPPVHSLHADAPPGNNHGRRR
jgi:hypothetical protein